VKKIFQFIIVIIISIPVHAFSQDTITEYAERTFWGNRVINGHSVETTPAGQLDFKISHRMGRLNEGPYEFFGLDQSSLRLGLEYGVTDWLTAGIGRSTVQKTVDGFTKVKLLRQSKGKRNMPVTVTYLGSIAVNTMKWDDPTRKNYFSSKLAFTNQILVGRKFNDKLSLQIAPTLVHKNLIATSNDHNDIFAIGFAGKYKFSNKMAFVAEYFCLLPNQISTPTGGTKVVNSFSLGVDIYTGKHVFQIHITNATTMIEKQFITETTDSWLDGNIHLGFNIIRIFNIVNK
jgi:hypothetical protein